MTVVRKLILKWHRFCVREKGHLVVGGGYLITIFSGGHNSALMAGAYGAAALMATHVINRTGVEEPKLKHEPKHLARS
jgi:S-adenosylhomocysteine hydrolase